MNARRCDTHHVGNQRSQTKHSGKEYKPCINRTCRYYSAQTKTSTYELDDEAYVRRRDRKTAETRPQLVQDNVGVRHTGDADRSAEESSLKQEKSESAALTLIIKVQREI